MAKIALFGKMAGDLWQKFAKFALDIKLYDLPAGQKNYYLWEGKLGNGMSGIASGK